MNIHSIKRPLFALLFVVALIALPPRIARAQVCGGTSMVSSTLQYIVRDAKGAAIDAARKDLQVAKSDSPSGWGISGKDFIGNYKGEWNIKAPQPIIDLVGKLSVIKASSAPRCNFAAAQSLQLTMNGKTMRLIFLTPHLPQYQSVEFLVDSIPFQEGIFSIDLPTVPDGDPKFYEAKGWKKITEAEDSMIQADASMWNRDYKQAVENWKRAATLNPGNPKIPRMLGFSYIETGQLAEAEATLLEAVRLNPKSAITHSSLAQAYSLSGKEKEAANAFAKGLDLCRDDPECDDEWASRNRANLKRSLLKVDASGSLPTNAEELRDNGVLHYKARMYEEAATRFEKATGLDPKSTEILGWLALTYEKLHRNEEAIAKYRQAIQLDPNDDVLHGLLGETYLDMKRYQEAVASLREAVRLAPNNKGWQDDLRKAQAGLNNPQPQSTPAPQRNASTGARQFIKLDPKVLDELAGQYQMPATASHQAFVLNVIREGDKLMSEAFGRKAEFLPYSETDFYLREEGVDLRFVRDAQGKITHIDWGGTIVKRIN